MKLPTEEEMFYIPPPRSVVRKAWATFALEIGANVLKVAYIAFLVWEIWALMEWLR